MERIVEFAINHYLLVGTFLGLLVALILLESRRSGKLVSSLELTRLVNNEGAVVVDVRENKEFREGHITDSRNLPFPKLAEQAGQLASYKEKPVIVVCKMGQHAGAAVRILNQQGFTDVRRLRGGITTWQGDGLPLIKHKGK